MRSNSDGSICLRISSICTHGIFLILPKRTKERMTEPQQNPRLNERLPSQLYTFFIQRRSEWKISFFFTIHPFVRYL